MARSGIVDLSDVVNHGTSVKTRLVFMKIGTAGPFAPEVVSPASSSQTAIASALASRVDLSIYDPLRAIGLDDVAMDRVSRHEGLWKHAVLAAGPPQTLLQRACHVRQWRIATI
jgi:hypothetical protein